MSRKFQNLRKFKLAGRHPYAVPFITLVLLVLISGGVYLVARQTHKLPPVHDAKIVIISDNHKQQIVPAQEPTVDSLLQKLNIKLNEGDVVEPAITTKINQDQFRINIYRAVPVAIVDGDNKTYTFSASKTPRAVAQQAGTRLYPEDRINTYPVQNFVEQGAIGEQVIVDRATPVNVDLYGTPVTLRTQAKTVAGLIKEKNIKLIQNDRVEPGLNTPLTPGQKLSFIRTGSKTETVTEEIAMPEQLVNDNGLAYGTSAIR